MFPSVGEVLRMATTGGAMTTPFAGRIGSLAVGKAADPRRCAAAGAHLCRRSCKVGLSGLPGRTVYPRRSGRASIIATSSRR
jgi:hypothetical protein